MVNRNLRKNISTAAKEVGLSAKTIRYYESIGLSSTPERGDNGYRYYSAAIIAELSFIKRARAAGFNLDECKELINLQRNEQRTSAEVKALTLGKIADLEARIKVLQTMHQTLVDLAASCKGDSSPCCAILTQLGTE